ncbi:MAG: hypothetical protein ACK4OM_08225, partial [Alphaproteobacteria bacterium]
MKSVNNNSNLVRSFIPQDQFKRNLLKEYIDLIFHNKNLEEQSDYFILIYDILKLMGIEQESKKVEQLKKIIQNGHCKTLLEVGFELNFVQQIFELYNNINNQENFTDVDRLNYISKILKFLTMKNDLFIEKQLSDSETILIQETLLDTKLDLFLECIKLINNISWELKHKFKENFELKNFDWEDFEYIEKILQYNNITLVTSDIEYSEAHQSILNNFNKESSQSKNIIRKAFDSIILKDLPSLDKLILSLVESFNTQNYDYDKSPKINLFALRALKFRILDQIILSNLLLSTVFAKIESVGKIELYAGLNCLITMAELCRPKYLSPRLQILANKENLFLHLIKVGDAIKRQYRLQNKNIIDAELNASSSLSAIIQNDFIKFHEYLIDLISEIYKESTYFKQDVREFWNEIYFQETQSQDRVFTKTYLTEEQEKILKFISEKDVKKYFIELGHKNIAKELEGYFKGHNYIDKQWLK